ncbi:flagellar basal body protein [Jannaschia sp. KMU-145]|uniref:flagellar basal body protein n=1 Tax=Jannaschia halovivens TaxID=3388667 RepID=UPI00396B0108
MNPVNEMPSIMRLAADAARHAATRQATLSVNVANADTPGFRARDVAVFAPNAGDMPLRRTRPAHLGDGPTGIRSFETTDVPADPNGNTVDLEDQILRGIDAGRAHNRAVTVYRTALDIMRASLGRR